MTPRSGGPTSVNPSGGVVRPTETPCGSCRGSQEAQSMAKIAVIGAGYVGLTTAACFSSLGHDVVCADIDEQRVERLRAGEIPIVEAGLEAIVREGMEGGRLRFVVGAEAAAEHAEFAYLCVPTPQGDDGSADLS